MAIARGPRLLVADEPTASLDASIRDHILGLLMTLKKETGAALVLLSHELSVVTRYCDMIGVMYGGRVVEYGASDDIFNRPVHPYTQALLEAAPGKEQAGERLSPIRGVPPVLFGPSTGCSFAPRCQWAEDLCDRTRPTARELAGRLTLCHCAETITRTRDGSALADN
jgi:oligopeptide/dipeptide ABC transporter ATP-binding protein